MLYSLPWEYWHNEILEELGNCLGTFIKISKQTKTQCYTAYSCICIYMDLSQALSKAIKMIWEDEDWVQNLDYEQVPFQCRLCHEYGHLFWECPLNHPKNKSRKDTAPMD